ncbi:polymorphic toxin-type HINT domain-containing protein [Chitinibacter sp. FCG-7]|uniref:Polymorphic toxin-type HINT domain-containing protein n=1 Tax=Chitinibacter mangrovi TaxID=3153927 RepID=A0AAU7F798_9NEIS
MGFVAGTLVHTKDGLRAIESLQVGDWVLAKDESAQGDTAYKQVLKTLRFEDKEIWYLEFKQFKTGGQLPRPFQGLLACTRNHPFWVRGHCDYSLELKCDVLLTDEDWPCNVWRRADLLYPGMVLELHTGDLLWSTILGQ